MKEMEDLFMSELVDDVAAVSARLQGLDISSVRLTVTLLFITATLMDTEKVLIDDINLPEVSNAVRQVCDLGPHLSLFLVALSKHISMARL